MLQAIFGFLANTSALWLIMRFTGLIAADGFKTLAVAVVVIGIIRLVLRFVLAPFLFGMTVITLGLFSLISGTLLSWIAFMAAPLFMTGFHAGGPLAALKVAVLYGILAAILTATEKAIFGGDR